MIRMTVKGIADVRRAAGLLMLTPQRKRRLLRKMGQQVARGSRARVTRQETVSGERFAPRAARRRDERPSKKKLLTAFRRHVRVRVEGDRAVIYVGGGLLGRWARQHQEGFTEVVQAKVAEAATRKARRNRGKRGQVSEPGKMATRPQAIRLRSLGWNKSQRWIMQTYSRKLAGYLIRKEEGRAPKDSFRIVVPARPFLGASAKDKAQLAEIVLAELRKAG